MSADSLECDVLVIGGGSTACMAAIRAHDAGAHVAIVSKGEIGNSGSSARAGGVIAAALPPELTNAKDDSPDRHFADTLDVGCGLSSEAHVRHLADRSPQIVLQLDRMGVPFSKDKERFHQIQLIGNTRERGASVIGGGAALMQKLRAELATRNITILEGYGATDLLKIKERVTGAVFQHTATNDHLTIKSRETILACGGASGLFRTISGDRSNTGDGIALAYKAGAEIANAEFIEFTLIFKVGAKILPIAGLSPFLSRGCTLINRDGIRFLEQQYSAEMQLRLPRSEILRAVVREIQGNRGPVFIECSRLSDEVWTEFETSVGKPILENIGAAGQDYRNDPIELIPAAHSVLVGIVTNTDALTTVDGLWAAGECATGIHGAARVSGNGLGACLVYGDTAGRNAAKSALADGQARNAPAMNSHSSSNESAAGNKQSAYFAAVRGQINDLAESSLGIVRESQSLEEAIKKFDDIANEFRDVSRNENVYGAVELSHLALVGGIMAKAAAARKESRGLHYRSDFPATDPEWKKWLILRKGNADDELIWSTRANFSKSAVHP